MSTSPTFGQVLDQLTAEGYLTTEKANALQAEVAPADATESPWYVKGLVGVSAWIAAAFLGTFFGLTGLFDSTTSMIIGGLLITAVAIGLRWFFHQSIFWGQLAFAFSLAGQGLTIVGIADATRETTQIALWVILLEVVVFLLYPDPLHRLLSVLAVASALVVILVDQEWKDGTHLLTLVSAGGVVWLWQQEARILARRWANLHLPLSYGLVLTLFGICVLALLGEFLTDFTFIDWWLSTLLVALALLYLSYQILRGLGLNPLGPLGLSLLLGITLVAIPTWQTPGILAALLVLTLGFWRENRLLLGVAIAFLLFFLAAYYYNLEITLLNKSLILMATGLVVLGLRWGLGSYVLRDR